MPKTLLQEHNKEMREKCNEHMAKEMEDMDFIPPLIKTMIMVAAGDFAITQNADLLKKVRERIEGMKKEVPTPKKIEEMKLTLTDLAMAESAVEFHAYNQALSDILESLK